ncbi:hypothetical protein ACLK1S_18565 [Escherichia coli]
MKGIKFCGLSTGYAYRSQPQQPALLNEMAQQRGQSMAQMALSWLLKMIA